MKRIVQFGLLMMMAIVFANCKEPFKKTLGNDYYLMGDKDDPATIKLVHGVNNGFDDVILGEIVDTDVDASFILVHRKVTENARYIFEDHPLWQKQLKPSDQYWIIEKKFDGLNGPMDYQTYLAKRKQLGVSDGIKIRL